MGSEAGAAEFPSNLSRCGGLCPAERWSGRPRRANGALRLALPAEREREITFPFGLVTAPRRCLSAGGVVKRRVRWGAGRSWALPRLFDHNYCTTRSRHCKGCFLSGRQARAQAGDRDLLTFSLYQRLMSHVLRLTSLFDDRPPTNDGRASIRAYVVRLSSAVILRYPSSVPPRLCGDHLPFVPFYVSVVNNLSPALTAVGFGAILPPYSFAGLFNGRLKKKHVWHIQ